MPSQARILVFSGSARRQSWNQRLAAIAADVARAAGAEATLINLRDYPMPIYDGDLEDGEGLPASALALKQLMAEHQGMIVVCPEYNSSITPLLKNTIDWTSRGPGGLAPYRGKLVTLLAASTGALGGLRGLVHVRAILGNIGVLVMPDQLAVGKIDSAIGPHPATGADTLVDTAQLEALQRTIGALVGTLQKLQRD